VITVVESNESPPEVLSQPPARELTASELQFCEGWSSLRGEGYVNAAQLLYTATIGHEDSALLHWLLTVSLVGTGDLALAHQALGETLALDPSWLRHRWDAPAHLGESGETKLREALVRARENDPLAPASLGLEASLALLSGDAARLAQLRGQIAESLLLHPDAPALAEILAEIRRRSEPSDGAIPGHPDAATAGWLAAPSCAGIPALGLSTD
jgi:hypothetical protein